MPNIFSEKSERTWKEGKDCLERGQINAATNRIYYSVFQAVKGFGINRGVMTVDSSDNVHKTALELVAGGDGKGKFFRRRLNELLSLRVIADYKPEDVDPDDLKNLLNDADLIRRHHIRLAGGESKA